MFKKQYYWVILVMMTGLGTLYAQDETKSPYFYLPGADVDAEAFPLLHTEADVNIAGVIADVKITQLYKNDGKQPIEAIYVFPASTRAAVYDMVMKIGEREIRAEIQEKGKARQTYQRAKSQGRSASLLEQDRPNVFKMKVANILPGDLIKVELYYTELLVPEEGTYEFVYPTVVGPRYTGESDNNLLAAANDNWTSNPYLTEGSAPSYTFDLKMKLQAGVPIQKISSPSHDVSIKFSGKDEAKISLKPSDKFKGTKDFIVQYQLRGQQTESGLLLYEGEDENYFMMMMQPPARPKVEEIPGREYIFVVDISGSMRGYPLNTSKEMLRNLIGNLRPTDQFNLLLFAGGSHLLSEHSLPVTQKNIENAFQILDHYPGAGGTNMLAAVQRAMAVEKPAGYSRSFVILTDGYINVEAKVFDYIRDHLDEANFFAFGIGSSVNRHLIEGIAHVGFSDPFVVTQREEAQAHAERFRKYIQTPVLTNISVNFNGMEAYDVTPSQIPDLMGERPLVVFGKYRGKANGKLVVSGENANGVHIKNIDIGQGVVEDENRAIRYLWARHKLKTLSDHASLFRGQDDDVIGEITNIGLQYNLLTKYTSFVAVDQKVRNKTGQSASVKQPLPLPDGVPNSAIGKAPKVAAKAKTSVYDSNSKDIEPPRTALPPPPPPPVINEVPEQEVEEDVEFVDQSMEEAQSVEPQYNAMSISPSTAPPPPPPPPPPEPEVEEIFRVVEEMPRFPGCEGTEDMQERKKCADEKLLDFIYQNLEYPKLAKENGVEGTVVIQFTIDKDGTVKDAKVVRDIGAGCGKEALRLVNLINTMNLKWVPGRQRGRRIKVQFNLPVKFKLN